MSRRVAVTMAFSAIAVAVLPVAQAPAAPERWFLSGGGVPSATIVTSQPPGGELPNYDPGRDDAPGIILEKSSRGANESNSARYQEWRHDASGLVVSVTALRIWAAPSEHGPGQQVGFASYLMDCAASCEILDAKTTVVQGGSDFRAVSIPLQVKEREFEDGHSLVLMITVLDSSDQNMLFAYGSDTYDAHLLVSTELVTTTTSPPPTSSTTTTTKPSTTSTSPTSTTSSTSTIAEAPASTSTTTSPTTTQTQPGEDQGPQPESASVSPTTSTTPAAPADGSELQPAVLNIENDGPEAAGNVETIDVFRTAGELEPAEGLAVAFATVAENIALYWQAAVGTGGVASILLWIGLRREEVEAFGPDSPSVSPLDSGNRPDAADSE